MSLMWRALRKLPDSYAATLGKAATAPSCRIIAETGRSMPIGAVWNVTIYDLDGSGRFYA
jgi:hypothetical protein